MAPLHNYMNTNIFSTYDVTKGITTKSPILVEIDGSKSGIYSPSPLIFTTAKIHTDSKTKLMEPLQVTPVPILSTIEGSVIRAGGTSDTDKIMNSFTQQSRDLIKSTCEKSDISEVRSIKDKQTITTTPTCVSSNIEVLSSKVVSNINENQTKSTNESVSANSFVKCTGFVDKSQVNGQLASNTSTAGTTLLSNLKKEAKEQMISVSNVKSNIDSSSNIIKPKTDTETSKSINNFKSLSDKSSSEDKASESLIKYGDGYKFSSIHQQNLDSFKSPTSMPSEIKGSTLSTKKIGSIKSSNIKNQEVIQDNIGNIEKSFTGSKKLQRQKNAFPQDIQQDVATISKLTKTDKSGVDKEQNKKSPAEVEKPISITDSHNIEGTIAQKTKMNATKPPDKTPTFVTTCNVASSTITSSIVSTPSPTITLSSTSNVKSVKTVDVVDSKSSVYPKDTSKLTSETSIVTPVSNSKNTTKLSSATSIKTPPTESLPSQSIQAIPVSGKPDIAISLSPVSYQQNNKAETSFKPSSPVVSTTLPSYIVSTSKIKIGSTFSSNTSTSTTKSQTSTPLTEIVYTKNAPIKSSGAQQSARPTVGLSPTNGTKHPNFSKQTKSDTTIKDGRA